MFWSKWLRKDVGESITRTSQLILKTELLVLEARGCVQVKYVQAAAENSMFALTFPHLKLIFEFMEYQTIPYNRMSITFTWKKSMKCWKIKKLIERRVNTRRLIERKRWFHFQWKFTAPNLRYWQRGIVRIGKNYGDRSMPVLLQTCLGRNNFLRMRILLTSWWGHYRQGQSMIQDLDCTQLRSPHEKFKREETRRAPLAGTSLESQGRFQRCNEAPSFPGPGQMAERRNIQNFLNSNRMGRYLLQKFGLPQHGWHFLQRAEEPEISLCTPDRFFFFSTVIQIFKRVPWRSEKTSRKEQRC